LKNNASTVKERDVKSNAEKLHMSPVTHVQKSKHLVKQPKPLPTVSQLIAWVCGLLGVRVGEASHPGPANIGTKRKAENEP